MTGPGQLGPDYVRITPARVAWRRNDNIMKTERFHAEDLEKLLGKQKIATLAGLKAALGTDVAVTVFRKLRELSYRTSYSHRGSYYTLDAIARFDEQGLWSVGSVGFSKYGTLLATVAAFVTDSLAGYFADELANILNVGVKDALCKLVHERRIARQKVRGRYLYCSAKGRERRKQRVARRIRESAPSVGGSVLDREVVPDELKAAIILFFTVLDEKQRRLYAGLESLKLGRGGDRALAALTGLDVHTVARGRRELMQQDVQVDRIRKVGGGRKSVGKKRRK